LKLGLIAEDKSDVDVLMHLARKLTKRQIVLRSFLGHGCGRIRAKCAAWADQLRVEGCSLLMIVTDLDSGDLDDLFTDITKGVGNCRISKRAIIIPVHEIEAWLLADHDAITSALRLKKRVRKQANPEAIMNPKEKLRDLVHERSGGSLTYLNTVHNEKIADRVRIANIRRCRSFGPFEEFVTTHMT
jgi:hypothetical protein